MDGIYKRMGDDLEAEEIRVEDSEIRKYFAKKTIFLTGSTGFMGKCLVEKLLRGCNDLRRIYVLVRPKRGVSAQDRISKYFDNIVFDKLRTMYPGFESKVHLVEGDLTKENMDLSQETRDMLIEEVNLVFHNASNVKFTERLSTALKINVVGTKLVLDMAKQCKKIEGFMYVSTAYSHCYMHRIYEQAYPSPIDYATVEEIIATESSIPEGFSSEDLKQRLGKYTNTYVYTKATAEGLVNDAAKKESFPCLVYRPSIVVSTYKEPMAGWVDNLNGPVMGFVAWKLGISHAYYSAPNNIMDLVPVDMSINAIIVAMWDAVNNRQKDDVFVYNFGSSVAKPVSIQKWENMSTIVANATCVNPSIYAIWSNFTVYTTSLPYYMLVNFFLLVVPACIYDLFLFMRGKKTIAIAALRKVSTYFTALKTFSIDSWRIDITEMNKAIDRMNPADQELFYCDLRKMDWPVYHMTYWNGLRVYILKDPMSTVVAARRRFRILEALNFIAKNALILLAAYVIARILGIL